MMVVLKIYILVIFVMVLKCYCIENNLGKTTEILYNLTNYAIESRRVRNPCLKEANYFSCIEKLIIPSQNYAQSYNYYQEPYQYPHNLKPYTYQNFHHSYQKPQSIMEILYTIATNDALRCIPRLLCEVTSDTISQGRQSFTLPTLPLNIDTKSIISLLSIIDLPGGSPIPFFTKAALLGYASKGNTDSCLDAYPKCPRDPNKLIHYLNNYNGGFFRFFSGVNKIMPQKYGLIDYPNFAQKRILNKPFYETNNKDFIFFDKSNRLSKTLTFPKEDGYSKFTYKKPKELPFSINEYYFNELDLQKPLPNHKATPMIFPTRTGTGDLRLDPEELSGNYKHQIEYNSENNNFVRFKPEADEGPYYESPQGGLKYNKGVFSFPV